MIFNSWQYFLFLPIVLVLYYFLNTKKQNILLVFTSYYFYAQWDYRFCLLLFLSTTVSYICGSQLYRVNTRKKQQFYIWLCVLYNIGVLAIFKYLGFGIENFINLLNFFNIHTDRLILGIILPVGISFYSFHAISYVVDIYRKQYIPKQGFIDVALFISFFPLLVAGPIERASHLLPQIAQRRIISEDNIKTGIFLIVWGLWKKVVIADNLAKIVNVNFESISSLGFIGAYLTLIAFAFQIYCDFSGYSDIARGTSRLLGFELLNNFNLPYFSQNPSEFWKRWHISLSSWLRDYLYISLGGNRGGNVKTNINLLITMFLGGLWHGAAWNYVIWGIYQGLLLVLHKAFSKVIPFKIPKIVSICLMFQFTLLGWMFFRCNAVEYINGIASDVSILQIGEYIKAFGRFGLPDAKFFSQLATIFWCIIPLFIYQSLQYKKNDLEFVFKLSPAILPAVYAIIFFTIVRFSVQAGSTFIYFQF
jgi:D-alanyl-lipoteichoic acid acyltransferase DltB (MBOAT superfamily)